MNFLKKYWQLLLPIVLIIVVLTQLKSCVDKNMTIDTLKALGSRKELFKVIDTAEVTKWKDKYGVEHIKAQELAVDAASMKYYADSVADLLKIKTKQVTGMSKYIASVDVNKQLHVDTFRVKDPADTTIINTSFGFIWRDGDRMKVWGMLDANGTDSVHIQGIDTLSRVDYWKRKYKVLGISFGAKQYYTDFSHTNPYIQSEGYKGVKQLAPKNNWAVGLQVGYGYQFGTAQPAPYFGVGLQYNVIKF